VTEKPGHDGLDRCEKAGGPDAQARGIRGGGKTGEKRLGRPGLEKKVRYGGSENSPGENGSQKEGAVRGGSREGGGREGQRLGVRTDSKNNRSQART